MYVLLDSPAGRTDCRFSIYFITQEAHVWCIVLTVTVTCRKEITCIIDPVTIINLLLTDY